MYFGPSATARSPTSDPSTAIPQAASVSQSTGMLSKQSRGGQGYNRAMLFEHVPRRHRRYPITGGSDEIQIRKVAGKLFACTGHAKG